MTIIMYFSVAEEKSPLSLGAIYGEVDVQDAIK